MGCRLGRPFYKAAFEERLMSSRQARSMVKDTLRYA